MNATANDLVADAHSRIQCISPQQLQAAQGELIVIDVREPGEFAEGHVPGAINLPRGVLEFKIEAHPALACETSPALADRERRIALYCLSGGRSALATDSLQRMGFSQLVSLEGGFTAWKDAGLPVTTG
ncbi:rhodanese-like domain-containing protein [Denitratimonas sp. CY0512]|uniref:rhodanese-like domain-containing protein n=1 Tax=Denitratimonas sp. CY0512 TaxID=3131940 RepID=UPI0030A5D0F5